MRLTIEGVHGMAFNGHKAKFVCDAPISDNRATCRDLYLSGDYSVVYNRLERRKLAYPTGLAIERDKLARFRSHDHDIT